MPLEHVPRDRRAAVDADVDALERRHREQQGEAVAARSLLAVDPQDDVPDALAGRVDIGHDLDLAVGERAAVERAGGAAAVVEHPVQLPTFDVERVPAALVAVGDEDALVAGAGAPRARHAEGPDGDELLGAPSLERRCAGPEGDRLRRSARCPAVG